MTTAALTLSLTGRYQRQGSEAAAGVRLWAADEGVHLALADDGGSPTVAKRAYADWLTTVDLLIGPYSSGLVRAIAPLIEHTGLLLWNHGGSADDLARPGIVSVLAPASTYLRGVVRIAADRGLDRLIVVQGPGPFARAVCDGAVAEAGHRGLRAERVDAGSIDRANTAGAGVLVAGSFEHDVQAVRRLRTGNRYPALVGAVAAGIHAFGQELGADAEGVLGPVQWWPDDSQPKIGPSGHRFAADYRASTGTEPSYVAAQVAATGYLAQAAHRQRMTVGQVHGWTTSTMLGGFALDTAWRQIGHDMTTVRWSSGAMVRQKPEPG